MEVQTSILIRRIRWVAVLAIVLPSGALVGAAPRWSIIERGSMTVLGDASPEYVRDVAQRLEQFRAALGGVVSDARQPPALPTIVYLFGSRAALQPYLPLRDGRPAALRGYFHRDTDAYAIAMSVDEDEESASIVLHEYAHLLVQRTRTLPTWLNEGLAEYFSTFALASRGRAADIGRPIPRHVRLLRQRFLPLTELLAVGASSELYDEGERRSIFYAEAWAFTHYLMEELPDGPALIDRYAAAASSTRAPDEIFREVFGVDPAEFEPRLREYVSRTEFKSRRYVLTPSLDASAAGTARRLAQHDADAWLGDLQRRVGRQSEAVERIERAAGTDPATAQTALALGRLRLDQNRAAEAVLALSKAIALDPSAASAFGWLAYAQMVSGKVSEARIAIARALALAPERPDFRLRDADIAVLEGHVARARAILVDLLAVTSDASVAGRAQERLNAIEPRR